MTCGVRSPPLCHNTRSKVPIPSSRSTHPGPKARWTHDRRERTGTSCRWMRAWCHGCGSNHAPAVLAAALGSPSPCLQQGRVSPTLPYLPFPGASSSGLCKRREDAQLVRLARKQKEVVCSVPASSLPPTSQSGSALVDRDQHVATHQRTHLYRRTCPVPLQKGPHR